MDTTVAPMTGQEWDHLVEVGLLDGPFELVGGRKLHQVTENPSHASTARRLRSVLEPLLREGLAMSPGHPLALGDIDRPEPDLAVVTESADHYATAHPGPEDTHLVVEVSVSSLAIDLGEKASRYALAGIPEYWVVDVEARTVVVHVDPDPERGTWRSVTRIPYGSPLTSRCLNEPVVLDA